MQTEIQKFTGSHYVIWAVQVQVYLVKERLWPLNILSKEKRLEALAFLFHAVDRDIVAALGTPTDPYDLWSALERKYGPDRSEVHLVAIESFLYRTILADSHELQKFISNFRLKIFELRACGGIISDTKAGLILLQNLPDHFQAFAQGYQASRPGAWNLDDLCTQLQRLPLPRSNILSFASISQSESNNSNESNEKQQQPRTLYALSSVTTEMPANCLPPSACPLCNEWHWKSACPQRFHFKCVACNKFGHTSSNCRSRKQIESESNLKQHYALSAYVIPQKKVALTPPSKGSMSNPKAASEISEHRSRSSSRPNYISHESPNRATSPERRVPLSEEPFKNELFSSVPSNQSTSSPVFPESITPDRRSVGLSVPID